MGSSELCDCVAVSLPFLELLVSGSGLSAGPGSGLKSTVELRLRLGSVQSRVEALFETLVM